MARPTKFRHPLDDLTKPHLASQIAGYVSEIELYRKQVEEIQSRIAQVYDDMDEEGFDKAIVRKLVAKRAKGEKADAEAEAIDAYEIAVEKGFSSRARVEIEKSYPERVSRPVQSRPGAEVGSAVRDGAPVSETATPDRHPAAQSEAAAGERPEQGADESASGDGAAIAAQSASFVTPTGEGDGAAPSVDPSSAADRPKFVRKEHVLRPHCQRPELCGSYGSKHCAECERAAKASGDDEDGAVVPAFIRKTHDHAIGEQA